MNFRTSFCDPFNPDINELGPILKNRIIDKFEEIEWSKYLQRMSEKKEKIYYSPSLEIENKDNKNGLSISVVGEPDNIEWYIFYKRPKEFKILFGLFKTIKQNYLTDITGQTKQDALDCLNALINNDLSFLENKIK
jgi:hypothetical protein